MLVLQSQHLKTAEVKLLQQLSEGEFDEKTLQKLVTKLSSTFEPYKPDKAIIQYLNQHTRQLGLEAPSFASPKEKQNSSNKFERQINLIGRNTEQIVLIKNESDKTLLISK